MEQRKVEREKWGEKSGCEKKSGAKSGARKVGCDKWGEKSGAEESGVG